MDENAITAPDSPISKRSNPEDGPQTSDSTKRSKLDTEPPANAGPSELSLSEDSRLGNKAGIPKKEKNISRRRDAGGWAKSRKGKESDGKNAGRRRGPRNKEEWGPRGGDGSDEPKAPRLPKRQCALLIGFCGTGCNGMQIQPDVRTIEGVLFEALVKAGAVSQDNANDPAKVNLGRAARTDAGVHAAGNLVSIKMITTIPGVPDIVARINEELPPEIRVWNYLRVQNSFNARLSCDSRKYTYFFPTYLLIPPRPRNRVNSSSEANAATYQPVASESAETPVSHSFWSQTEAVHTTREDDLRRKRSWRIPPEQLVQLREAAKKFEGTHNFHNFTVGRAFTERSCERYMKKIEISDPAIYGETEWVSVMLHGQSFMLHQRKMIAIMVLCCRTSTPISLIDELYRSQSVNVPKMPALGLLLEHPIFDVYNVKVSGVNKHLQPTDPEYRPLIDFDTHRETMSQFKEQHIYTNMRTSEDNHGVFDAWIRTIDKYRGDDLLYLNPEGTVPPAAIVKHGERRVNAFKDKRRFDATNITGEKGSKDVRSDEEDEEEPSIAKKDLADMEG